MTGSSGGIRVISLLLTFWGSLFGQGIYLAEEGLCQANLDLTAVDSEQWKEIFSSCVNLSLAEMLMHVCEGWSVLDVWAFLAYLLEH